MTTHSSILAWKIPWTEELGGLQPMGLRESLTYLATKQRSVLEDMLVKKLLLLGHL